MRCGRVDVDRLLDELTPEEFAEHWAVACLDGWAGDTPLHRIGLVAAEIRNAALVVRQAITQEDVDPQRWSLPIDWVPDLDADGGGSGTPLERQDVDEMEAAVIRRYG